jgi:hypothetical protein
VECSRNFRSVWKSQESALQASPHSTSPQRAVKVAEYGVTDSRLLGPTLSENLLAELREVRPRLQQVEGILATPKAIEVMRRLRTSPAGLAARYENDRSQAGPTELIGYRLSSEAKPDSETCVHVAFDPELERVVIYEEW